MVAGCAELFSQPYSGWWRIEVSDSTSETIPADGQLWAILGTRGCQTDFAEIALESLAEGKGFVELDPSRTVRKVAFCTQEDGCVTTDESSPNADDESFNPASLLIAWGKLDILIPGSSLAFSEPLETEDGGEMEIALYAEPAVDLTVVPTLRVRVRYAEKETWQPPAWELQTGVLKRTSTVVYELLDDIPEGMFAYPNAVSAAIPGEPVLTVKLEAGTTAKLRTELSLTLHRVLIPTPPQPP